MDRCITSKGFTIIEVLISLVILSISLLALAGLMVTTTRNNSFGGNMTEAATFAQDRLENFRAMKWQAIAPGADSDVKTGSTGVNYARNWNVVQNGNLKTISVTINWNDQTGHQVTLLSVVSQ
jgi:prepilin-type N-terminal cleavage/methylation domain-containing protein